MVTGQIVCFAGRHCLLVLIALVGGGIPAIAIELGLPAACTPGRNCYVQNYPDMDPGPGAVDPFCGSATYDGHNGTDFRLLSFADMARGVPALAMADGKVLRWRDGEPDRLFPSVGDRKAVGSRECGNGVVIDHGDGIEVQYCHMKQGSIAVRGGDVVRKGDQIGEIGASGLAQFPHIHVTVRENGVPVDLSSGKVVGGGCEARGTSAALFSDAMLDLLGRGETQLVALGLTDTALEHSALVVSGPPIFPTSSSSALVGWAWMINLRRYDRIFIAVTTPAGDVFAQQTTEAMDRPKASYSAYAGKQGAPSPGAYGLTVMLIRDGKPVYKRSERYRIK